MELPLELNSGAGETLQAQIFEQVRHLILGGRLKTGMALPPSRLLAGRLGVSRNTVVLAYERLAAEGYIESRGTAGTFVNGEVAEALLAPQPQQGHRRSCPDDLAPAVAASRFQGPPIRIVHPGDKRLAYDFWIGRPDPHSFPLRAWRRGLMQQFAIAGRHLTEYSDPAGHPALRRAIADHVGPARGMAVAPEQVIVTSGSQDGLNLIARLVIGRRTSVYVENPGYQGAVFLFQALCRDVQPIPVDANGLDVGRLPETTGGFVYVTPSHQYPTGATLSLDRRLRLLRWAQRSDAFIIEDDYDSDFRYDGPPLTSVAGLDEAGRVFYLGTFSKALGAGLRLGFVVVPPLFAASARAAKSQMSAGSPWVEQAVLAELIESGRFVRHLRRMRQIYKARRDRLVAELHRHFGPAAITGKAGGLHLAWRLPDDLPRAAEVERRARAVGVGVYALDNGGAVDLDGTARDDVIVFGYSSLTEREITRAIDRLADALRTPAECRQKEAEDV